jgi:hypothetical protein
MKSQLGLTWVFAAVSLLFCSAVQAGAGRAADAEDRFTGSWVWKVDGRKFLIAHLEQRGDGKLAGSLVRPDIFRVDHNLIVDGVSGPVRVERIAEVRREAGAITVAVVGPKDPSKASRWLLARAGADEVHMKLAGVPGMKSMRLKRVPRGTRIAAAKWDPMEVYEGEAVRVLPGKYLRAGRLVKRPPASLRLDPFYSKYVDAGGIAVVGSAKVPAAALLVARDTVGSMLRGRSDIRGYLVAQRARVAVMAAEESITDLPEHRGWKKPARDDPRLTACERDQYDQRIGKLSDRDYWNARARGIGGMLASAGAENLLAQGASTHFGENILMHEFAHTILFAVEQVDSALYGRVQKAYRQAMAAGRWKGDYAAVTVQEYWAEGTQFWFNSNVISRLDDGTILSAEDLRRYDPALYSVLAEVYGSSHRIEADPFHMHLARLDVPLGRKSADC